MTTVFQKGDRVRLVGRDHWAVPGDEIASGAHGTVRSTAWLPTWSVEQVLVDWRDGRTTVVSIPPDKLEIVKEEP